METLTRDVGRVVGWYTDGAVMYCEMVHRLHTLLCEMYESPEYRESRAVQVAESELWVEEEWGWM